MSYLSVDAPFAYYGGKSSLAPTIVSYFPAHKIYVEVFGGSAAVLLYKPRSEIEVYNDAYSTIVNFFRILRDQPEDLIEYLRLMPTSREEHAFGYEHMDDDKMDAIRRAAYFYTTIAQSISGKLTSRSWRVARSIDPAKQFQTGVEKLYAVGERLLGVVIEHYTWQKVMDLYDTEDTLFYCDPPYHPDTRSSSNIYRVEMDSVDHIAFLQTLRECKGKVLLSGYSHPIYDQMLSEWRAVRYNVLASSTARTRANDLVGKNVMDEDNYREEIIWIKPGSEKQQTLWDGCQDAQSAEQTLVSITSQGVTYGGV